MGKLCCYNTLSFHNLQVFFKSVNLLEYEKSIIDLEEDERAPWRLTGDERLIVHKNVTSVNYIELIERISCIYKVRSPFIILLNCDLNVMKCILQYPNLIEVLSHNLEFEQDINGFLRDQLAYAEESYEF